MAHSRSGKSFPSLLLLLALIFTLTACQTTPEPPPPGLTREQIAALISSGFTETEDGWELNLDARLLFDSASAALNPSDKASLDKIAQTFLSVGISHIIVEGHTDNTGSESYNRELSRKRATMVAQYLATNGMPLEQMEIKAVGSDNPVASNATREGRRENRRTVIIVPSQ
jgi:outer membrane protein OmpA-like peptidoglycan-associated protein